VDADHLGCCDRGDQAAQIAQQRRQRSQLRRGSGQLEDGGETAPAAGVNPSRDLAIAAPSRVHRLVEIYRRLASHRRFAHDTSR